MRLDPRTAVLAQYDLSSSDRLAVKQVKGLLVEDQYATAPNLALRLARDAYNDQAPMHLIWDASRYNSKGQLWLASVEASVSAALLEAHGVTHVWPAGYQRAQTHDPRFYYLPTQDGTGVLAGDIPMAQVVENLVSVARGVLKGYSYVLCCRNGAHRSAMLLALLLMLMSGRTAEQVYHYMRRLRSLVDLRSLPPRRKNLETPISWLNRQMGDINRVRQQQNLPAVSLNDVVTLDEFRLQCGNLLQPLPSNLRGRPVLPPPPAQRSQGSGKGEGDGQASSSAGSQQPVPVKAMPAQPSVLAEPVATGPLKAEEEVAGSAGREAVKKEKEGSAGSAGVEKEGLPGSAGVKVEAAETAVPPLVLTPASEAASSGGPGVRLTEGPGARQAERGAGAAGVKEEAGEKRKQTPEMEVGEAQAQAKPKMEERSGSTFLEHVREVMQSLVSMRARLVEAARSTSSAEAAALLEDQVDYGDDDDDVDIEAASQALSAGGDAKALQLLQLLRDEQQKLAAQVEALAAATSGGAGAGEDELVERAWVALQSRDAEEAERLLKELPPSTVANMKDASGVTPLHVSARERWIGLTAWLLKAAPSLATATTFSLGGGSGPHAAGTHAAGGHQYPERHRRHRHTLGGAEGQSPADGARPLVHLQQRWLGGCVGAPVPPQPNGQERLGLSPEVQHGSGQNAEGRLVGSEFDPSACC